MLHLSTPMPLNQSEFFLLQLFRDSNPPVVQVEGV